MAALTKGRRIREREGRVVAHPVAAATKCFTGGLAVLDAAGNAAPGSTAVGLKAVGVFEADVDNSAGAAGDVRVNIRRWGVYPFANAAADPIDRSHIMGLAYIVDDQTVAATTGAGTRSVAGTIIDVDAQGVWIEIS